MMQWIYLSPHLDDVVLSCGGLIWEQVKSGEKISIWTICAGDQPNVPLTPLANSFHNRWNLNNTASQKRREEDVAACKQLCSGFRHFSIPDCIYRRAKSSEPLYDTEEKICGEVHPQDYKLIDYLVKQIEKLIPKRVRLVCPLALGNHVDHQIIKMAVNRSHFNSWFFADYPYVIEYSEDLNGYVSELRDILFPISSMGLSQWIKAVACYRSQISTFWANTDLMGTAITDYCIKNQGVKLWRKKKKTT